MMDNEQATQWMWSIDKDIETLRQRLNEMQVDVESDFDEISKRVNNATTKADELLKRVDALEAVTAVIP